MILALAFSTGAFAATVHTVDPAGVCGGNPSCFTTITAAVGAASNGDTITVWAGTYNENVAITSFDDLHVVAADTTQPTVFGALDVGVGGAAAAPVVVVNGGGGAYCFAIDNSNDVSVVGFRLGGCSVGIQVFNSRDTVIEGLRIGGGGVTMGILDGANATTSRITGNMVSSASSFGILLRGDYSPYVADNRVTTSGIGMYVSGTDRGQVLNNQVTGASTYGVEVIGTTECRIERNTVSGSGSDNLYIVSTALDTSWVGNRLSGSWTDLGTGSASWDNL